MAILPNVPPILDEDRYIWSAPGTATSTMNVTFPVFGAQEDLAVFVNFSPVPSNEWTFTSLSGTPLSQLPLPITDGVVTFNTPVAAGSVIVIIGNWQARQLIQPSAPGIARREFNQAISTLIAAQREVSRLARLALQFYQTDLGGDGFYNAGGLAISNVKDPVQNEDAVNLETLVTAINNAVSSFASSSAASQLAYVALTGDGTTTTFSIATLGASISLNPLAYFVTANELLLDPTLYSFDTLAQTITFTQAPASGADIIVRLIAARATQAIANPGELWLKGDFDAAGDNLTDDTTAVLAWVAAGMSTGKRLRAEPGVYIISGSQWVIDLASLTASGGAMATPGVQGTPQQTGLWIEGSGKSMTVFDVSACTSTHTQFLLTDTSAGGNVTDSFYVYLMGFKIQGNNPGGRAATFGPDESPPNGFNFPHAINDLNTDIIVENKSGAANSVGLRMNQLVTCFFAGLEVNLPAPTIASPGPTYGIEMAAVTMSCGRIIVGGCNYAIHYLNGYSFANKFYGCDIEIVQQAFLFDSPYGGAADEWHGQFVWGALTANVATTCQDGTTSFAVANSLSNYISISGNLGSAAAPIITGADAQQVLIERGHGQFEFYGGRPLVVQTNDASVAAIQITQGSVSPNTTNLSQSGANFYINNLAGGNIVVEQPVQFSDGTLKKSGDQVALISQPSVPSSGTDWQNTNNFPLHVTLWAGNITVVTVKDTLGGSMNWNPQVTGEQVPFVLPPGWKYNVTYSSAPSIRVIPF